jgi:hypothetical protein
MNQRRQLCGSLHFAAASATTDRASCKSLDLTRLQVDAAGLMQHLGMINDYAVIYEACFPEF